MRLEWSLASLKDRDEILDYIGEDDREAAIRTDISIEDQAEVLMQFPRIGRAGRVAGTRELVIQHTPYIVVYRVKRGSAQILRVLHGARHWPERF